VFIINYFDNSKKTIDVTFDDIKILKQIKLDTISSNLNQKKQELLQKITTKNLIDLSRQSKVILLKPVEIKK